MFHFTKAYILPLTGNECYRALKSSMPYVVFNIRAPVFSSIYMRSILKSISSKSSYNRPLHWSPCTLYETLANVTLQTLKTTQQSQFCCPRFPSREAEAQRGHMRCPKPPRQEASEPRWSLELCRICIILYSISQCTVHRHESLVDLLGPCSWPLLTPLQGRRTWEAERLHGGPKESGCTRTPGLGSFYSLPTLCRPPSKTLRTESIDYCYCQTTEISICHIL